jgi:hypothetical protein
MVQHYHSQALHYLQHALQQEADAQPAGSKVAQLLRITDEMQRIDWRKPSDQPLALQLLQALTSLINSWNDMGTQWVLARRLVIGVLLQGLNSATAAIHAALQDTSDQLVKAVMARHVDTIADKGMIHFMHVSKSAGELGTPGRLHTCALTVRHGGQHCTAPPLHKAGAAACFTDVNHLHGTRCTHVLVAEPAC